MRRSISVEITSLLHSVACTGLFESAKWRTVSYVIHLCSFLQKTNWRWYYFGLFSPIVIDAPTWLSIENLAGWGKDSTSCFCLVLSPLKKTNRVCCFSVLRNCPLPFVKPCYFTSSVPFNSTALPIFWQLNLPRFLVITSLLWSLNTYGQGSMWSAVIQEALI